MAAASANGTQPSLLGNGSSFWSPSDVTYRTLSADHLAALTRSPDLSAFDNPQFAPIEAQDLWFRELAVRRFINGFQLGQGPATWNVLGRYDPSCLPSFNPLAGGRLDAYAPPQVKLPGGQVLGPTNSMADYVNSPPLILTNLAGAQVLASPKRYAGAPGDKFISAIRVRVQGTSAPGPIAEARLARVAAQIHDRTGLSVDIVKGSSPLTVKVDLPAGKFGRPALTVTEGWSAKGVAIRFVRALSSQNLALFALALVAGLVLVSQTAFTTVRRRRAEFGVLRAIGWPSRRIALLVEIETLALGLTSGVLALLLAVPLVLSHVLGSSSWQLAAVIPLDLVIAAMAALIPALTAAKGTTVTIMSGPATVRGWRLTLRSTISLAVGEIVGARRMEALIGAGVVALGGTIVGGVVLISTGFRGQLDATVLGVYLAGQVRGFHVVIALLTLVIAALAVSQIVMLSYLERQPELATLRAVGWPRREVTTMLAVQGIALGLLGGILAAALIIIAGIAIAAGPRATMLSCLVACLASTLAGGLGVVGPLIYAYRTDPAEALRGE